MTKNEKSIEPYVLLMEAGQCLMYLLWIETAMRDLVVLQEGGDDMRKRYSEAFGKTQHPSDFARNRLELGKLDFGRVKERFLDHWPHWKRNIEIHDAIERVVLWRNALGHMNIQPFRDFHLYTPDQRAWNKIKCYMKCGRCFRYYIKCSCNRVEQSDPPSLVIDSGTIETIYTDIRKVDLECFYPTAITLDIEYLGVAWPNVDGGFEVGIHNRVES